MSRKPSPTMDTVVNWIIRGFAGMVNMVEMLECEYDRLRKDQIDELVKYHNRLQVCIAKILQTRK